MFLYEIKHPAWQIFGEGKATVPCRRANKWDIGNMDPDEHLSK